MCPHRWRDGRAPWDVSRWFVLDVAFIMALLTQLQMITISPGLQLALLNAVKSCRQATSSQVISYWGFLHQGFTPMASLWLARCLHEQG